MPKTHMCTVNNVLFIAFVTIIKFDWAYEPIVSTGNHI